MGFLNVYNNFRNFNAHISHAFKVTFFDNIPENGNILLSTCVKSITKPVFKLDTEKYNYNFGNSRFVIPIIDFSSARMSVTFYEEDNMAVQAALTGYLGNLGGFVPEVNILLEEFTNDMLYIISSKVYRARLIELSLPGFNNEGEGSIQEITAEFNVTRIYDSLKEFETSIQNYKTEKTYTYEYNTVDRNGNIVNTFSINNINKAAKKPSSVKLTNKTFTQELYIELLNKRKRLLDAKAGIESAKTNNEEDLQDGEEFLNSLKANLPTNDESKRKQYETILNSVRLEDGKYKVNIARYGAVAGNYTDGGVIKEYDSIDDLYVALNDTSFNKASGIPGMSGYNENQDGVEHTGINLKISMEDLKELIVYNSEAREIGNATNEIEKLDGELAAIERRLGDLAHDNDVKQLSKEEILKASGGIEPPAPSVIVTGASAVGGAGGVPPNTPPELIHTGYHYVKGDGTMGSEIKFDPPAGGNLHVRDESIKETVIGTSTAVKHAKMKGEAKTNHEKAVIEKFSPIVLKIAKEKNIDEAMLPGMFAQMMQESGWLTSYDSTKEVNNFFGLTGAASGTKSYVVSRTHEVAYELKDKEKPADRQVAVIRAFSQYDNAEDAIRDWMDRTVLSKRYQFGKDGKSGGFQTGGWEPKDVHSYIKVMKNNGYATATNYINEVNAIIDKHPSIKNLKYK